MNVIYSDKIKDLPSEQLRRLFMLAGWSDGLESSDQRKYFNIPFINSTLVISAWEDGRLIGAVRVLSDTIFRSVIYDLVIEPESQNKGIGRELVRRCIEHFPDSEWLVETTEKTANFYERIGFRANKGVFLRIPTKHFGRND